MDAEKKLRRMAIINAIKEEVGEGADFLGELNETVRLLSSEKRLSTIEEIVMQVQIARLVAGNKQNDEAIEQIVTDFRKLIVDLEKKVAIVEAERNANIAEIKRLRGCLTEKEQNIGIHKAMRDSANTKAENLRVILNEQSSRGQKYYSAVEAIIDLLGGGLVRNKKTTKKQLLDLLEKIEQIVKPIEE